MNRDQSVLSLNAGSWSLSSQCGALLRQGDEGELTGLLAIRLAKQGRMVDVSRETSTVKL